MTWKGTLRSMQATARRAEREAQRRQRELERQHREFQKMEELEQARYEVEMYENHIELLRSVHTESGDPWDWEALYSEEAPEPPVQKDVYEETAAARLQQFTPSIFDKLLGRVESKRTELNRALEEAREKDAADYKAALGAHEENCTDWQETRELAGRILSGEKAAYLEAIEETELFADISTLGSSLSFHVVDKSAIEATLHVNGEEVVPKEVKSLLTDGCD